MRIGLVVPDFTWPNGPTKLGAEFATIARNAEDAGFCSFWVQDHFFQILTLGPADHDMLEGYVALGYAAGVTYRHPGILVKEVTTLNVPQALQRPHPPILIGGTGEQKTLRLVAQYGDACNFARLGTAALAHKLDVLRGHCEALGRPYTDIEKTAWLDTFLIGTDGREGSTSPQAVIDRFGELAELGFDTGYVSLRNVSDPDAFTIWASAIVPSVSKIPVAGR